MVSEPPLPKLKRLYRRSSGQSTSGLWPTADQRFMLFGYGDGWTIRGAGDENEGFLERYRISRWDAHFPTRRAALEALALALHLEGQ